MPVTAGQLSDFPATLDELQAHNRARFLLDKTPVSRSKMRRTRERERERERAYILTCLSQTLPGVTTEAAPLSKSREVSPEMEGLESEAVFHKEKACVVEVRAESYVVQFTRGNVVG